MMSRIVGRSFKKKLLLKFPIFFHLCLLRLHMHSLWINYNKRRSNGTDNQRWVNRTLLELHHHAWRPWLWGRHCLTVIKNKPTPIQGSKAIRQLSKSGVENKCQVLILKVNSKCKASLTVRNSEAEVDSSHTLAPMSPRPAGAWLI